LYRNGRRLRQDDGSTSYDPVTFGAGFANGVANLHNAKRAKTPLLNLVGEHTTQHVHLDAPLAITLNLSPARYQDGTNHPISTKLSEDLADAFAASRYGQISTLIIPNDYQQAEITNDEVAIPSFRI